MQVSEMLELAGDAVEQRGWCVGSFPDKAGPHQVTSEHPWGEDGGRVCIEGGIVAALAATGMDIGEAYRTVGTCPAYEAMSDYLGLAEYRTLYRWNDKPERTEQEVLDALRGAAKHYRLLEEAEASALHASELVSA